MWTANDAVKLPSVSVSLTHIYAQMLTERSSTSTLLLCPPFGHLHSTVPRLPATALHLTRIQSGGDTVMALAAEQF